MRKQKYIIRYKTTWIDIAMQHNLHFLVVFSFFSVITSCTPLSTPNPRVSIISPVIFVSDSGQTVQAVYRDDDTVTLTFPDGRTEILNLAVSASGARYTSGINEWWEHQGEATYSVHNEQVFTGRLRHQSGH
ncbi:MliC family protein [uncultured Nitrosomonas sp.]|uniref:MliC family protein n=2 Tax=Nitrosomonas TaxID=914 RepID=UPI0026356A40|nr:MliC family protein [uncultured Nitrosomonas sp.]